MESERTDVTGNGTDTGGEQSPSGRGPVYPTPPEEDVGEGTESDPASLLRLKYAPFLEHLESDELEACILDAVKDNDMEDVVHYTQRLGNLCEYYRRDRSKLEEMYQRVVRVALDADPIPASEREDGQLEPPWEVFARVVEERDTLIAWSKLIKD